MNLSDYISSRSNGLTAALFDFSEEEYNRINLYSSVKPIRDNEEIIISPNIKKYLDIHETNYTPFYNRIFYFFTCHEENFSPDDYREIARIFTSSRKNKFIRLLERSNRTEVHQQKQYALTQLFDTSFEKWYINPYKYSGFTSTSLQAPLTDIPSYWAPTVGDGYGKGANALIEKVHNNNNTLVHFYSENDSGLICTNFFSSKNNLMVSFDLFTLNESRFNILIYFYDKDMKYINRKRYFSFQYPRSFTPIRTTCPIFQSYLDSSDFIKICFELSYGDVLLKHVNISSFAVQ